MVTDVIGADIESQLLKALGISALTALALELPKKRQRPVLKITELLHDPWVAEHYLARMGTGPGSSRGLGAFPRDIGREVEVDIVKHSVVFEPESLRNIECSDSQCGDRNVRELHLDVCSSGSGIEST
jgi:hypothetical protein